MTIEEHKQEPEQDVELVQVVQEDNGLADSTSNILDELREAVNDVPEAPEDNEVDSQEEEPETEQPGTAQMDEETQIEEEDPEDDKGYKGMSWKRIASGMIGFVDRVSIYLGKKVGKARLVGKFEEKELQTIKAVRDKRINKKELNADQIEIMQRWMESEEKFRLLDDVLPLTEEEKGLIEEPLSACLEKWKTNLTPETMLIIAIIMVLGPKALHVMDV